MNQFFRTLLEFLKHAAVEKFAADLAKSLLSLLIEWVEGIVRQRQAGLAAA